MVLKYILLGLLSEPSSGYELKKACDISLNHFWAAKLSQIYPTLKNMEAEGFIVGKKAPSPIGPDRKLYSRTKKGREELLKWLSGKPLYGDVRFNYAAQAFFLSEKKDAEKTLQFYYELREIFQKKLAVLEQVEQSFEKEEPGLPDTLPDDYFYPYLTLRMGIHKMAGNIAWCDECIMHIKRRIQKKENKSHS